MSITYRAHCTLQYGPSPLLHNYSNCFFAVTPFTATTTATSPATTNTFATAAAAPFTTVISTFADNDNYNTNFSYIYGNDN